MPVRIRLSRDAFELKVLRGNLQPGGEGGDDIALFLIRSQHKVDGFNFKNLYIPLVCGLDDPVMDAADRKKILNEFKQFAVSFFVLLFCAF